MSKLEFLLNIGKGVLVLSFFEKEEGKKIIINRDINNIISTFSFFTFQPYHLLASHLRQLCDLIIIEEPFKTEKCLEIKQRIQQCTKPILLEYLREKLAKLYAKQVFPVDPMSDMLPPLRPSLLWTSRNFNLYQFSWEHINNNIDVKELEFQIYQMEKQRYKSGNHFDQWEIVWKRITQSRETISEDLIYF